MFFLVMILLVILSPLVIPVAVTVVHEFGNWRGKGTDRMVRCIPPGVRPAASRRIVRLSHPNVTPPGVTFDAFLAARLRDSRLSGRPR